MESQKFMISYYGENKFKILLMFYLVVISKQILSE
jgi:hypothetical protein